MTDSANPVVALKPRLSLSEYRETPEYAAHDLIQLIDGELVIAMAPIPVHQEIVGNIHVLL